MFSSISNKYVCFIGLSLLIVLSFIVWRTSLACAATTRATRANLARNGPDPGPGGPILSHQQNNQAVQEVNNGGGNATFVGNGQGNSGNQGFNKGLNQANAANGGNQVSGQRKIIGIQQNNQILQATNNGGGNATFTGTNQGNSGNQGINQGNNQDNSGNLGNQVNNQGDIIGTQINDPGTEVNNQGSTVQHQVNYINLLPNLGIGLSLYPHLQLSLGLGR